MEKILAFANNTATSEYAILLYIAAYILIILTVKLKTQHWTLGFLTAEFIPCLNLTAYITGWLTPEFKPFMPLWITIIMLFMPFIFILVERFIMPLKPDNKIPKGSK